MIDLDHRALSRDTNQFRVGGVVHEAHKVLKQLEDVRLTLQEAGYWNVARQIATYQGRVQELTNLAAEIASEVEPLTGVLLELFPVLDNTHDFDGDAAETLLEPLEEQGENTEA